MTVELDIVGLPASLHGSNTDLAAYSPVPANDVRDDDQITVTFRRRAG